jgi:predicted nucleotidyltransferase component of viral defense system
MINPREIKQRANEAGVRDQQIELDYILSWILFGISKHGQLSETIVFKGGTALKKVYFEDYRFSEDLDFTILKTEISNEQIIDWFEEIFQIIKNEANIPLQILENNKHEEGGINFYINYIGPLGGLGNNKKVKIDISRDEELVFEPSMNDAFICYSDLEKYKIICYKLEEILVEKMRSVMQRMQARDFYDIWYLLEQHGMNVNYYLPEFYAKCSSKGLLYTDFTKKLNERLPQYKGRWKSSMGEQIKDLPDFDQVVREVKRHLRKVV